MKKIFRFVCVCLFMFFAWPWLLYNTYGNKKCQLAGRTVVVCNHRSTFDAFFIYLKFRKNNISFVTIEEARRNPITCFVTWLFDCLYLKFDLCDLKFFKDSISILNNNGIICIFPEGYINPNRNTFLSFKASFVYLALKTNSSVLPLYISPNFTPLKVSKLYVGEPISAETLATFPDRECACAYVQGKIMEYGADVES